MTELQREEIFADRSLVGTVFCRAYSRRVDEWLQAIFAERVERTEGIALVATGGYGRATLSPQSDLDLLLLAKGVGDAELSDLAQLLWFPIWDEGLKLGHAVRTIKECVALAKEDLDTATSLLSIRHLAGDAELTRHLVESAEQRWRKDANRRLPQLADAADRRRHESGEVAFLLEPDLKESGGGLRDAHALGWARQAGVAVLEPEARSLRDAEEVLLAARVELGRSTGRQGDRLLLEEQDPVAAALGIEDADEMMLRIARAGRTISWIGDEVWNRARHHSVRSRFRRRTQVKRLSDDYELVGGVIELTTTAPLAGRDDLLLEISLEAARREARIGRDTLDRFVAELGALSTPWPESTRVGFVNLLAEGHRAIPVIDSLDQVGLFVRFIPEWAPTQNKPQRNQYHRFTVDRHLCEAAAEASRLVDRVDRHDLLLIGALLHDIGKGYPGDHTIVGMELIDPIAARMGFPPADVATLVAMVEHHLLLPDAATRRDIEDEDTLASVAAQAGTIERVQLLGALTEADSIATGPAAWSNWKAGLVADLVRRTTQWIESGHHDNARRFPTPEHLDLMAVGERVLSGEGSTLTVVLPDEVGLFSRVAGALAVNGLDVIQADIYSEHSVALQRFEVESQFGAIDWHRVTADIDAVLHGEVDLAKRLAARVATYAAAATPAAPAPIVETDVMVDNETSTTYTVIEVAAPDRIGLLHHLTAALTEQGLDIAQARVQTLGDHVVDSFYVRSVSGDKLIDQSDLDRVTEAVLSSLEP